jgi:TonB family protein
MISDASVGWVLAFCGHAAVAVLSLQVKPSLPAQPEAIEMVLESPPTPQESPAPERPPELEKAPAAVAAPPLKASSVAVAPPLARAGALIAAAGSTARGENQLADFTQDPNSVGFGSGTVAIGGTARHAGNEARIQAPVAVAPSPIANGDGVVAASDLSEQPGLGERDPCRGFFPPSARDDVASATVAVTVSKDGHVSTTSIVSESPAQQGFGSAARACMSSKRFTPGRDRSGNPVATRLRVHVRFTR